jgi:hypothetical protein
VRILLEAQRFIDSASGFGFGYGLALVVGAFAGAVQFVADQGVELLPGWG